MKISVRVTAVRHYARMIATLDGTWPKSQPHSGHYLLALLNLGAGTAYHALSKCIKLNDEQVMKKFYLLVGALPAEPVKEWRIFQRAREWAVNVLRDEIFGTGHLLYFISIQDCRARNVIEELPIDFKNLWTELRAAEGDQSNSQKLRKELDRAIRRLGRVPRFH